MSILLPKIMKIEQKISLLGLKKYLQDESQQSLITAYIKLLKKFSQNQSDKLDVINVKTSGYVHYINYYLKILNSMHKVHKTWRQAKITWENGSQDLSKPEVYHNYADYWFSHTAAHIIRKHRTHDLISQKMLKVYPIFKIKTPLNRFQKQDQE